MSEPIVFISRNRIKKGKTDEFKKHYRDSIQPIMAGKPDTVAQLAYEDEEATEVTIVRLFPSADALDFQIQGANERSKKAYEFIEPISIEIFGMPNSDTLEMMKKITGSEQTVYGFMPSHIVVHPCHQHRVEPLLFRCGHLPVIPDKRRVVDRCQISGRRPASCY